MCLSFRAGTAPATILVARDLGDLARGATAIVVGRVLAVHAEWDHSRARIYTIATVGVERALKGAVGTSVTVRTPGGVLPVERVGYHVGGAPTFEAGETVVLFLRPVPPNAEAASPEGLARTSLAIWSVVGWQQGKFSVGFDSASGRLVAWPRLDAALMDPVTKQRVTSDLGPVPLDELERRVRVILGSEAR